jgi:hypothetical protein
MTSARFCSKTASNTVERQQFVHDYLAHSDLLIDVP